MVSLSTGAAVEVVRGVGVPGREASIHGIRPKKVLGAQPVRH